MEFNLTSANIWKLYNLHNFLLGTCIMTIVLTRAGINLLKDGKFVLMLLTLIVRNCLERPSRENRCSSAAETLQNKFKLLHYRVKIIICIHSYRALLCPCFKVVDDLL